LRPAEASRPLHEPRGFLLGWDATVRRKLVHGVRKLTTEAGQQFLARKPCLLCQPRNLFFSEDALQFARCHRLIGSGFDPGLGIAFAILLKLIEEVIIGATLSVEEKSEDQLASAHD
jgi:hypothetical protein